MQMLYRLSYAGVPCTLFVFLNSPFSHWSGKRDLNPRPSAWKADALPLSYSRAGSILLLGLRVLNSPGRMLRPRSSLPHPGFRLVEDSNLRRLRRQIYSLLPLTAREPLRYLYDHHLSSSFTLILELAKGIEPPTSSLQVRCSTFELRQQPCHTRNQTDLRKSACGPEVARRKKLQTPLHPAARQLFRDGS
jgi:hypothetical protein